MEVHERKDKNGGIQNDANVCSNIVAYTSSHVHTLHINKIAIENKIRMVRFGARVRPETSKVWPRLWPKY